MSFNILKQIVKEYADECIQKYREECLELSDGMITAYLIPQIPRDYINAFYFYQMELLRTFRQRAKESLDWLNE